MKGLLLLTLFVLAASDVAAQNWDIDLLRAIHTGRNPSFDSFFRAVTDYAAPLAYTIPVFLWLYALITKYKQLQIKSGYIILATLLAYLVTTTIKQVVGRERPYITYPFIEKLTSSGTLSFPSGHTSDAFTLAIALSLAFPKWFVILPSFLWASAVGYSRMSLGVHYPTDVLASIIIAALVSLFCFSLLKRREKRALLSEKDLISKDASTDRNERNWSGE